MQYIYFKKASYIPKHITSYLRIDFFFFCITASKLGHWYKILAELSAFKKEQSVLQLYGKVSKMNLFIFKIVIMMVCFLHHIPQPTEKTI